MVTIVGLLDHARTKLDKTKKHEITDKQHSKYGKALLKITRSM